MGCGVIIPILETQIAKKRGNEIGTSTGPGPNYSSPQMGERYVGTHVVIGTTL